MSCVGIDTANAKLVGQRNDNDHDLIVNDSPHPHASCTFGLLNVNLELSKTNEMPLNFKRSRNERTLVDLLSNPSHFQLSRTMLYCLSIHGHRLAPQLRQTFLAGLHR